MGLFSKKEPCPICGGKVSWLLARKIDGQKLCDTCGNKIDMDIDVEFNMTMDDFRQYLLFYDENQLLKDKFIISEKVDFGLLDTKMIFDYENKLFCMSKRPDRTVFEGAQIKSFTIKEDNFLLFEGNAETIKKYSSTVPERAMVLAPQLAQYVLNRRMIEDMEKKSADAGKDGNVKTDIPTLDIKEPFDRFKIEFHFDHPYWKVFKCDMTGPRFSDTEPDVNEYIDKYYEDVSQMEKLVNAIKTVAFPDAAEQNIGTAAFNGGYRSAAETVQTPTDTIGEIKKYKELLEQGIITQAEFDSKKKQLMGI